MGEDETEDDHSASEIRTGPRSIFGVAAPSNSPVSSTKKYSRLLMVSLE